MWIFSKTDVPVRTDGTAWWDSSVWTVKIIGNGIQNSVKLPKLEV